MTIRLVSQDLKERGVVIKVVGIGGAGGNAINRMVQAGIQGVELIAINTDEQALRRSEAYQKLQIGKRHTRGLGCGGNPVLGRQSAEESREEIKNALLGADMVFITAGMGGGTGTGGAPIVGEIAQELKALTVSIVTKPFEFEGRVRMLQAEEGTKALRQVSDTLLAIPNERLFNIIDKNTLYNDAFKLADDVLRQGVQAISDVITNTGDINVDFADVKTIMLAAGEAFMGIGTGDGPNRTMDAVKSALHSPLLEDEITIEGAKGVLVNFTTGPDFTLAEMKEPMNMIYSRLSHDAHVYVGHVEVPLENKVKVTIIATGFPQKKKQAVKSKPYIKESLYQQQEDIFKPAYLRYRCKRLK